MTIIIKKYKKIIPFLLMVFFIVPEKIFAQYGLQGTANRAGLSTGKRNLNDVVGSAVSTVYQLLGVVFLVLIIYGGIMWMVSSGDQERITKARKIIVNATIGLAIVLMAYMITFFVVSALTRATI